MTGDMERLPFADASFDVVVICWTLYFMRDIDAALDEMKRCLKARGRFIAATSARDHESEAQELVARVVETALGRPPHESDIGNRFDLETGAGYLERHFPTVATKGWRGELVLPDVETVLALWSKWEPGGLSAANAERARDAFARLVGERIERDGAFRVSRRECAFICDLE